MLWSLGVRRRATDGRVGANNRQRNGLSSPTWEAAYMMKSTFSNSWVNPAVAVALSVCGLLGLRSPARAAATSVITVPAEQSTIQGAINVAQNGDTVEVSPGIYYGGINFLGKAVTVESVMGPRVTVIDGSSAGSVVVFDSKESAQSTLKGFTIQHGVSPGSTDGGGIVVSNASPTIVNNIITDNLGCDGGGMAITGGSSPLVEGNIIRSNQGICGGLVLGGGIYVGFQTGSPARIIGNTIEKNSNYAGGGIGVNGAGPVVQDNVIRGNHAVTDGGGFYTVNSGSATLTQNLIVNNEAGAGGGMYISLMGQFTAINNTVAGNVTNQGSSIWVSGPLADMAIYNNILQGQSGQTSIYCAQASGSPVAIDNDINAWHASAVQGCVIPSAGNISRSPRFVDPRAGKYELRPASPCVNAGDNSAPGLPGQDLAGQPRIVGANVDQGAYELQN